MSPKGQPKRVEINAEPGFVASELALTRDVLRIANRLATAPLFEVSLSSSRWRSSSGPEGPCLIESLCGLSTAIGPAPPSPRPADILVLLGGAGVAASFALLLPRIQRTRLAGGHCLLLSDAASEWAKRQSLLQVSTAHWEDKDALLELNPDMEVEARLFDRKSNLTLAAGMLSTADVVLDTIVAPVSSNLAQSVSRVLVMERIRSGDTPQRTSESENPCLRRTGLAPILRVMETNLEEPLTIREISEHVGVSPRQMERNFRKVLGYTPGAYYRTLRVKRAQSLLETTELSLSEIALRCGFGASSSLSRQYQQTFGHSPAQRRRQLLYSALT